MALDVTDRDEMTSGTRLSKSVTSSQQIELYLLQIETNRKHPDQKSKSVTPGPLLAAKMLQIEIDRDHHKEDRHLCGGRGLYSFAEPVLPDSTVQGISSSNSHVRADPLSRAVCGSGKQVCL